MNKKVHHLGGSNVQSEDGPTVTGGAFSATKVGDVLLGDVLCPALHAAD